MTAPTALRGYTTLIALYVAQAIPIYLIIAALPAILRELGVSRSFIGAFAILFIPWLFKYLWAPFIDRFPLIKGLGRRRSWILPMQFLVIAMIVVLSQISPAENLMGVMAIACVVAVAASTQDIATDGYAVELLSAAQRSYGSAIQGGSIAVGVVIGSGLTLFIYDLGGWQVAMLSIAGLATLSAIPIAFMKEVPPAPAQEHEQEQPSAKAQARPSLLAFVKRPDILPVLSFALLYRCSEGFVKAMEQPFMVDKGLSLSLIGLTSGVSAATVGLFGSVIAALLIRKTGLFACLYGLGLLRTLCFAGFALAAALPVVASAAVIGLAAFNTIIRYMEVVALYSLYMGVSSKRQAATDFSILSCAQLKVYMVGSLLSGVIADTLGYTLLFGLASLLSYAKLQTVRTWR